MITTRMHEFMIKRRAWITVDALADRFLASRSRAYSVIRELVEAGRVEMRSRPNGRGFEYRGKCS